MWSVFEIIGAQAPSIAAAAIVAMMVGVAAFKFWEQRSGDFFDVRKSEAASTSALAVKIMAMSAEQNKTIAAQCATIASQQTQISELRADLERCVAECAKCHDQRAEDRLERVRERAERDRELATLKAAVAAIRTR